MAEVSIFEDLGNLHWLECSDHSLPISHTKGLHPDMLKKDGYVEVVEDNRVKKRANVLFDEDFAYSRFDRLIDQLELDDDQLAAFLKRYTAHRKKASEEKLNSQLAVFAKQFGKSVDDIREFVLSK